MARDRQSAEPFLLKNIRNLREPSFGAGAKKPGDNLQGVADQSASVRPIKVALISNAPPRQCGIATFAGDCAKSLADAPAEGCTVEFVPLLDRTAPARAADEADASEISIETANRDSFREAARAIDDRAFDVVWLQHEFGIFGGYDGEFILDLAMRLATPLVVTFHTVLSQPSSNQRRVMERLGQRASKIMVMSHHGKNLLASEYGVARERIEVIEHGAPDRPFSDPVEARSRRGEDDRTRLATFGLIGPGKGLEHVIEALPKMVETAPHLEYRIIGATHPNLVASEGEAYRDGLKARIAELGIERNVEWVNAFLDPDELLDELQACDIYISPYPNLEQTTSGTLAYALAMGRAIVATPYVHARELLGDGTGELVAPCAPAELADTVTRLLADPDRLRGLQQRAYRRGRSTVWSQFARRAATMLRSAAADLRDQPGRRLSIGRPVVTPVIEMTDRVGIMQHTRFNIPDRKHGYAIDDCARALMLTARLAAIGNTELTDQATTYAAFLQHGWNEDVGAFRNFMGFDCRWLEDAGSEDSQGRAFWALGEVIASPPVPSMRDWAVALYDDAFEHARQLTSPRAMAFAMLGASARLLHDPEHRGSRELLRSCADELVRALDASRRPDWAWFERLLAYDNTRLSEALIKAGQLLDEPDYIRIGLETLEWIAERQIGANGVFRPIGSDTFDSPGELLPFDQQPLEALAFIEVCLLAGSVDSNGEWSERAICAWDWFFGRNDRGIALVDLETMRCHDGLTPQGRNQNSGAESILAFILAHVAMLQGSMLDGGALEESGPERNLENSSKGWASVRDQQGKSLAAVP